MKVNAIGQIVNVQDYAWTPPDKQEAVSVRHAEVLFEGEQRVMKVGYSDDIKSQDLRDTMGRMGQVVLELTSGFKGKPRVVITGFAVKSK